MKNLAVKMIFVMFVITACSGLVLSGMWAVSVKKIEQNARLKVENALKEIVPNATRHEIKKVGVDDVYYCYGEDDTLVSYFFLAAENGFQAPINVAAALDPALLKLVGIRILEQSETPGLGAKITEVSFTDKFASLMIQESGPFFCLKEAADKNKGQIQAITGATISSQAVVDLLNNKINALRKAGL